MDGYIEISPPQAWKNSSFVAGGIPPEQTANNLTTPPGFEQLYSICKLSRELESRGTLL
jgi:hypothetical protein